VLAEAHRLSHAGLSARVFGLSAAVGQLIVMRKRSTTVVKLALLAGPALVLLLSWPRAAVPLGEIRILNYRNIEVATGSIYPPAGNWIVADLQLTNKSAASLVYASWAGEPYGWLRAETPSGWINKALAPPFTGDRTVVRPRECVTFPALLPPETLRWRCGFEVRRASTQDVAWRLLGGPWGRHVSRYLEWTIQFLSATSGPAQALITQELKVDLRAHNQRLEGTPGERSGSSR
jgi:hypothetical protein